MKLKWLTAPQNKIIYESSPMKEISSVRTNLNVHSFSEIDECGSDPCLHSSTCIDKMAGYECMCVGGYTGPNCETGESTTT